MQAGGKGFSDPGRLAWAKVVRPFLGLDLDSIATIPSMLESQEVLIVKNQSQPIEIRLEADRSLEPQIEGFPARFIRQLGHAVQAVIKLSVVATGTTDARKVDAVNDDAITLCCEARRSTSGLMLGMVWYGRPKLPAPTPILPGGAVPDEVLRPRNRSTPFVTMITDRRILFSGHPCSKLISDK